ncbi:MAG: YqjD family protein [Candidatus Methylacidiphilaceae bacterium]
MNEVITRQKLLNDVREVLHDAEILVKESAGNLGEKARDVQERLTTRIGSLREYLGEREDLLADRALGGAREVDRIVRDHPYQTVGVGVVFGILLGALLSRR